MNEQDISVAGLVTVLLLLGIYFFPALIAWARGNRQTTAIFILNLLLGWTLLGWVGALVWAFIKPAPGNPPIHSDSVAVLELTKGVRSEREPRL